MEMLPAELIAVVLKRIGRPSSVAHASSVGSIWKRAADDATLWRSLAVGAFDSATLEKVYDDGSAAPFKLLFKKDAQTRANWLSASPSRVVKKLDGKHAGTVSVVAIDADMVASGSSDGTIFVRSLARGEHVLTLRGHTDAISALLVAAKQSRAFSGSWDKSIRVWCLESGVCLQHLLGHARAVMCLCHLGGCVLASGGGDGCVIFWNVDGNLDRGVDGGVGGSIGNAIDNGVITGTLRSEREDWPVLAVRQVAGGREAAVSILDAAYADGSVRRWACPTLPSGRVNTDSDTQYLVALHEDVPADVLLSQGPLQPQPSTVAVTLFGKAVTAGGAIVVSRISNSRPKTSSCAVRCRRTHMSAEETKEGEEETRPTPEWAWSNGSSASLNCLQTDGTRTIVAGTRGAHGLVATLDAEGTLRSQFKCPSPVMSLAMSTACLIVGCADGSVLHVDYEVSSSRINSSVLLTRCTPEHKLPDRRLLATIAVLLMAVVMAALQWQDAFLSWTST